MRSYPKKQTEDMKWSYLFITLGVVIIFSVPLFLSERNGGSRPSALTSFRELCRATGGTFYDDCVTRFAEFCGNKSASFIEGKQVACNCHIGYQWGLNGCEPAAPPYAPSFKVEVTGATCDEWHDAIEQAFRNDNFCETDDDCTVITLGGEFVEFGCYKFIHRSVSEERVYAVLSSYSDRCTLAIDDCARAPRPVCVSNRCATRSIGSE